MIDASGYVASSDIEAQRERPGEDWRSAYVLACENNRKQLQQDRAAQARRRVYIGHATYVVKDMSDAQIDTVSRRLAERDCERGINEQRMAELRSKHRAGCAA